MFRELYSQPNMAQSAVFLHNDYLNDESCNRIQNIIRNNFFSKINKAALIQNQQQPILIKKRENIQLPQIKKNNIPEDFKAKQKIFNNKIRKNNFERIERYKRMKNKMNSMSSNDIINVVHNYNDYREELEKFSNGIRKAELPKLYRKPIRDPFEIKYEPNYIDNVEKLFIKPYLVNDNELYTDYIENKKSKIPLNFII